MYESLHNHTIASDGSQTYLEVLQVAEELGFGTVAFTDHDTLPDDTALHQLAFYEGPVKWLLGTEISSGLPHELGGAPTGSLHILGLFTDPDNEALRAHCAKAISARTERMEQMVKNLNRIGIKVSVEDCLRESGGENVGRRHIANAIFTHPENEAAMDAIVEDMRVAAKDNPEVAMHLMRLAERDRSDYPFQLFLAPEAYLKDVYVDYLYWVDMDSAVKLIRDAGGIAILAHWHTIKGSMDLTMIEGMLRDGRLDGLEIMGKPGNGDAVRASASLRELVEKTGSAYTYGIDGHSFGQMRGFANDRALSESTVGQTAKLVARYKPNLDWTNFPEAQ